MLAVGSLRQFADTANGLDDGLLFSTSKNPLHVQIKGVASIPHEWEAIGFENGVPDTEDLLGLSQGTYLVFYSESANVAMHYRVRGTPAEKAGNTAFKQMHTVSEIHFREGERLRRDLEVAESTSIELARKLEKQKKKAKKRKKKLKEKNDGVLEDLVYKFAEGVTNVLIQNGFIRMASDEDTPNGEPINVDDYQ